MAFNVIITRPRPIPVASYTMAELNRVYFFNQNAPRGWLKLSTYSTSIALPGIAVFLFSFTTLIFIELFLKIENCISFIISFFFFLVCYIYFIIIIYALSLHL